MKITGMTVYVFEPRPSPYQEIPEYAYDPWHQNGVAVLHTDEGIDGVASSRSDRLLALAKVFRQARDQLVGQDPLDRARLNQVLTRRFHCPAVVLGAFDHALWDIAGKRFELPIYRLIGAAREKVAAYGSTMHLGSDDRFLDVVDHALGLGLRAIKLHPYGVAKDDVRLCEKVPDLDHLQFGWLTADTARLLRTVFARRVRGLGLTRAQWLALTRINRRPGVSQSELAEMMEIEKAPAGRIVDRLEEKSWVERRAEPSDRRVNRIYLTELGARVHAAITPLADATVRDALASLKPGEQARLVALMSKVKAQLTMLAASDPRADFSDFDGIEDADDEVGTSARAV